MDANSPKITKGTRKGCSYNASAKSQNVLGNGRIWGVPTPHLSLYSFDSFLREYCDLAVVHRQECHLAADQFVG